MLTSSKTYDALLALTRLGIGNPAVVLPDSIDWQAVQALANVQGLSAVVLDGVERLRVQDSRFTVGLDKKFLTQWIGEVLQGYEYRYEQYRRAISEMAGFYNKRGYKMMVLKGYACCLDWPKPEHRPCGDIDIWQFGEQESADQRISEELQIPVDKSHHHHTVFYWRDFMVENHYDFINVHHHKSHMAMERILKELGSECHTDTTEKGSRHQVVELYGEKVWLPSPNLHALFLMKHLMLHFSTGETTLRQVLDWAFFMKKHGKEVEWDWLMPVLDEFHMQEFFNIINAICVEDLGFSCEIFPIVQFNPEVKERVLSDIFSPEFSGETPRSFLPRVIFKYRRWKANGWKHKLCFSESMLSAFWSGVKSHLLKPSSI